MKKCVLIFGLILISGSAVMARCCDCCDRHYHHRHRHNSPVVRGYGYMPAPYYPNSSISVSVGRRGSYMGFRNGFYAPNRSRFSTSVRIAI